MCSINYVREQKLFLSKIKIKEKGEHNSFLKINQESFNDIFISAFVDCVLECCQCNQKIHLYNSSSVNIGAINKPERIINL